MTKEEKKTTKTGRGWPAWTALALSVASLLVSIYVICTYSPRCDLSFDYLGFIVGLLSLCAVFTVGYQIYNALTVERRIKDAIADEVSQAKLSVSISAARSDSMLTYMIYNTNLRICVNHDQLEEAIGNLKCAVDTLPSLKGSHPDLVRASAANANVLYRHLQGSKVKRETIEQFCALLHDLLSWMPASEPLFFDLSNAYHVSFAVLQSDSQNPIQAPLQEGQKENPLNT